MPIPTYQAYLLPMLKILADGEEQTMQSIVRRIVDEFNLSEDEKGELLPSGQQTIIANRIGWAKTYLKKAGLLENPARGRVRITPTGAAAVAQNPSHIDAHFLRKYPCFLEFVGKQPARAEVAEETSSNTPEESIESAHITLRNALADELLERVKACSPQFFEQLVVKLLVAMGYGGSLSDAGQAIGRSGDAGIDGIIKEDRLGLDVLCIQAKRWERNVGRPEVQAFAGSMEGYRARKGVLITTSSFSREAEDYIGRIERKIVLIDGRRLAQLMIDFDVGVSVANTYVIKKADLDFFLDDVD